MVGIKQRLLNIFVGVLDQPLYVILTLGAGSPDETLSAAAWRTEQKNKLLGRIFRPTIDFLLGWYEKDHCYKSYLSELHRKQLPQEYK